MSQEEKSTDTIVSRTKKHNNKRKRLRHLILIIVALSITMIFMLVLGYRLGTSTVVQESGLEIMNHKQHEISLDRFQPLLASNVITESDTKGGESEANKEETNEEEDEKGSDSEETNVDASGQGNEQKASNESTNPSEVVVHKVQPNETLFIITMLYYDNSSAQEKVAAYNGITNPEKEVQAGMDLQIPDPSYNIYHHVVPGESLSAISNRYYGTGEYAVALAIHNDLQDVNHIPFETKLHIPNPSMLQKDAVLPKVKEEVQNLEQVYHIEVNKKKNELYVFQENNRIKTITVSTGKDEIMTPVGEFKVVTKIEQPWHREGGKQKELPENPLGTHWLGLDVQGTDGTIYGLHGTDDPTSIGNYVNEGTVHMNNTDIKWLYETIPIGTIVTIY